MRPRDNASIKVFARWSAISVMWASTLTCADGRFDKDGESGALVVYNAASIARPMRAVLDSFVKQTGFRYEQETGASLELVRKITQLDGAADVVALADADLFTTLLAPRFASWHVLFGRNRIVIGYTPRSRFANEINADNWWEVLQRPGVEVGRADPGTDPSGYRTLLVWQLAERFYESPGLYGALLASAPSRNVRPREAEQIALLETGELDYIWTYENLIANAALKFVKLPDAIDLGSPNDSAYYRLATVRVPGRNPRDSITINGQPILFGVTVLDGSRRKSVAHRFINFMLSPEGRSILRLNRFDAIDSPSAIGGPIPPDLDLSRRRD